MSSRELGPEWVLSAFLQNAEARGQDDISELAIVARAPESAATDDKQNVR